MLQNYIEFLKGTIDKLTSFRFDGSVGAYFEAVGLGFLTIFLVVLGIIAIAASIVLPVIVCRLPWKLMTKKLVKKINDMYETDIAGALSLYRTYEKRKRIYIGVLSVFLLPFVVPFIMILL